MSSGEKMFWRLANALAYDFLKHIADQLQWYCIAGSIRRGRPWVGDIELVVHPHDPVELFRRMDSMVNTGIISMAQYGDGENATTRWGNRYRGCIYRTKLVEVFICDEHNRGYQQWLRTGAGDKNSYVMNRMKKTKSPVRFSGGYGWHVTYNRRNAQYDINLGYAKLGKLNIPDEYTLYWLLGMPVIKPHHRKVQTYQQYLGNTIHHPSRLALKELYIPEPKQQTLI